MQNTPKAVGEGLYSDSNHNWRYLKIPTNGVSALAPTNSEFSITKPTSEDSKVKRRKFNDIVASFKPIHRKVEGFVQPIQPAEMLEV